MNTNNTESSVSTTIKAERGLENPKLNSTTSQSRERTRIIDDGRRQLVFAPLAWLKLRFTEAIRHHRPSGNVQRHTSLAPSLWVIVTATPGQVTSQRHHFEQTAFSSIHFLWHAAAFRASVGRGTEIVATMRAETFRNAAFSSSLPSNMRGPKYWRHRKTKE